MQLKRINRRSTRIRDTYSQTIPNHVTCNVHCYIIHIQSFEFVCMCETIQDRKISDIIFFPPFYLPRSCNSYVHVSICRASKHMASYYIHDIHIYIYNFQWVVFPASKNIQRYRKPTAVRESHVSNFGHWWWVLGSSGRGGGGVRVPGETGARGSIDPAPPPPATADEESSNLVLWYTLTSLLIMPGRGRSRRTWSRWRCFFRKFSQFVLLLLLFTLKKKKTNTNTNKNRFIS